MFLRFTSDTMVPTYTLASAIQQAGTAPENRRNSTRSSPYLKNRRCSGEEPLSSQRLLEESLQPTAVASPTVDSENYSLSFFHWDPTIADIVRWEGVSFK